MNEKPEALYITLPREVVEQAWWHIEWFIDNRRGGLPGVRDAAAALLKALNAPSLSSPPEDIEALTAIRDRQAAMLRRLEEREAELDGEIGLLRRENERLREALPYDWDQLEACRESLREHMAEIKRLREALKLALNCHGKLLMSDPPQDAWKFWRVDEVIVAALRREET